MKYLAALFLGLTCGTFIDAGAYIKEARKEWQEVK
jgi:hypothetical protein